MTRRWGAALAGAAATTILLLPTPAAAHAVLEGSEPSAGARVERLDTITLRFSERVDPHLSSVELLTAQGVALEIEELTIGERPSVLLARPSVALADGTYLVTWRAFSLVDGHVTAGAFPFGHGVDPAPIAVPEPVIPGVSPIAVIGRAWFLLGLALAVGAVVVELLSPLAVPRLAVLAAAGSSASMVGVAIFGHQQRVDSGASVTAFLASPIGGAIGWRIVGLLVATGAALAWRRWMRRRHVWAPIAGAALLGVIVLHSANGHAAASGLPQVAIHTLHVAALAAWVGGFVPLLTAISRGNARRVVQRFSTVALPLVAVVIVTGQARAFGELGSVAAYWSTTYGRVGIAKSVLLLGILAIAATNRRSHVARVAEDPEPLRRAVRLEASLGAVVIGLGALLANIAPRSGAAADDSAIGPVRATATSFAGDVEANLIADPGTPGSATITLELRRLPERTPIDGSSVELRVRARGRPGGQAIPVPLTEVGEGIYSGTTVLTPPGPFEASVLVQGATGSAEIVIPFATRTEQRTLDRGVAPTITDVTLDDGRVVQLYLDPEEPGQVEFHATFFDATGTELPVDEVHVVASGPDGIRPLVVRALTPGHVVADAFLGEGTWRFDVTGIPADGGPPLSAWVERTLAS